MATHQASPQATSQHPAAPDGVLTNQDSIKLRHIGLAPEVIIAKIKKAQQVAFKLETHDQIARKAVWGNRMSSTT